MRVRAERRETDRSMVGSNKGGVEGGDGVLPSGPALFGGEKLMMGEFPEENTRFGKHRPFLEVRSEGLLLLDGDLALVMIRVLGLE